MLKGKIFYQKAKSNQRVKTLQSFCKYQENRFNQAEFSENFNYRRKQYRQSTHDENWTDMKIEEIKRKYGMVKNDNQGHQRYYSTVHNLYLSQKQKDRYHSRQILRQRSLSNVQNSSVPTPFTQNFAQTRNLREMKSKIDEQNIDNAQPRNQNRQNKLLDYCGTFNTQQLKFGGLYDQKQQKRSKVLLNEIDNKQNEILGHSLAKCKHLKGFFAVDLNPRISNIDKINEKIKSMLQNIEKTDISITQNRKQAQRCNRMVQKNRQQYFSIQPSYSRALTNSKYKNENDLVQTRILQNTNIQRQRPAQDRFKHQVFQANKSQKKHQNLFHSIKQVCLKTQGCQKIKQSRQNNHFLNKSSVIETKSVNLQKQNEKDILHRKKFSCQRPKAEETNNIKKSSLTPEKADKLNEIKVKYSSKLSYRSTRTDHSVDAEKKDVTVRKLKSPEKMVTPQKKTFNEIYIKEDKSQSYGDDLEDIDQVNEVLNISLDKMIKLTKSGIETRKRTKQNFTTQTIDNDNPQSFKQFLKMLTKQISLDQSFRQAKYWFKYFNQQNKWSLLSQELKSRMSLCRQFLGCNQIQVNQQKCLNSGQIIKHLKRFEMMDEQIDPFYTIRLSNFTLRQLVDLYFQAEQNWSQICNSGILNQLANNKWISYIDIDKKGYANLTDLTRFANFDSNGFYRNRDLSLVFSRLVSNDKLSAQTKSKIELNNVKLVEDCLRKVQGL